MKARHQPDNGVFEDNFPAVDRLPAIDQSVSQALPKATRLHDVRTVARRLNVSEKTVRRLITRNDLWAYRVGRQLRVSEEELIRYLDRGR
jgi:excisionase family DNA binding protein